MDDSISRRLAIDLLCRALHYNYSEDYAVTQALDLPSAQPEIIRCKDCKHYDGRPCGIVDWYNTTDDFCSKAERRTDG